MTDKRLLELAAKAMHKARDPNFMNYEVYEDFVLLELGCCPGAITGYWRPLADDGDALRLAVKLGIDVGDAQFRWYDKTSTDPYAATRRAIVCAAAEIGKAEGEKDE